MSTDSAEFFWYKQPVCDLEAQATIMPSCRIHGRSGEFAIAVVVALGRGGCQVLYIPLKGIFLEPEMVCIMCHVSDRSLCNPNPTALEELWP